MELVPIYEGPTIFCALLREELRGRGITSVQQAAGPFLGIIGDAAQTPYSLVLIGQEDLEHRQEQVQDCLALVCPEVPPEGWELPEGTEEPEDADSDS